MRRGIKGPRAMSKEFRVLLVTNAYAPRIGGISEYLAERVRGLASEGIKTEISAMPEKFNQLDETARGSKIWWRTIHLIFVAAFIIRTVRRVARLQRGSLPLVVHSHSASYCLLLGVLAKALGSVTAHTFHSPLDKRSALLARLLPRTNAVVFVSQALRAQFGSLGLHAPNVTVIPGAVDTSRFHPPSVEERRAARTRIGSWLKDSTQGRILLFVGRVVPEKGVDVLIAACQEIFDADPRSSLFIVGPFGTNASGKAFVARCQRDIRTYALQGRVAMPGALSAEDVLAAYHAADILVCPSSWPEPASVAVSEGMACGLPVVASRVGGLHERIEEGVTGLLVPPNDPGALAREVLRVLEDPDLGRTLAREARTKALRDLDGRMLCARHLELYNSLLDEMHTEPKHGG